MSKPIAKDIIDNNFNQQKGSFLYFLQDKSVFDKNSFKEMLEAFKSAADDEVGISRTAQQINYIYGRALKCFMYHFDKNDKYKITDLPENYNKMIEILDKAIDYYFKTRI